MPSPEFSGENKRNPETPVSSISVSSAEGREGKLTKTFDKIQQETTAQMRAFKEGLKATEAKEPKPSTPSWQ